MVLAVVGQAVPEARRSPFLGIASTGGSSGQLAVIPPTQSFIFTQGWTATLLILAGMSAIIVPLAAALTGKPCPLRTQQIDQSLADALVEARGHSGYVLLTLGFFVCGWQIGSVAAHLPAYLADHAISASIAPLALAAIGLFNILGTFAAGTLGGRYRQKHVLGGI